MSFTYARLARAVAAISLAALVSVPTFAPTATAETVEATPDGSGSSLVVATFNVRCANCSKRPANSREKRWEVRAPVIVDQILREKVDVIGVQEASPGLLDDRRTAQFEDLVDRLGGAYRVTDSSRYNCTRTDTTFTNCGGFTDRGASQDSRIIYNANRLTRLDGGSLRLDGRSIGNGSARYMAWAKFQDARTGKKFIFATAHFEPGVSRSKSSTRVKQVRKATAELNRVDGGLPVIWASDLASSKLTHVGNKAYDAFKAAGFTDPLDNYYKAKTAGPRKYADKMTNEQYFTLNNFAKGPKDYVSRGYKLGAHLDYILIKSPQRANVTEWKEVLNLDSSGNFAGVIPSDHNMVRATVVLP